MGGHGRIWAILCLWTIGCAESLQARERYLSFQDPLAPHTTGRKCFLPICKVK